MSSHLDSKYRLVVFVSNKNKVKEIDIIPRKWIYKDKKSGKLKCYFMPPPYIEEKQKNLLKMIKNCDDPAADWPSYLIEVRGKANSYEDAEKLVNKLQYQAYVYSTDNDESAKLKAKNDEDFLKNQNLSTDMLSKMMDFARVNLDGDVGDTFQVDRFLSNQSKKSSQERPGKKQESSKQLSIDKKKNRTKSSLKKASKKKDRRSTSEESRECSSTDESTSSSISPINRTRKDKKNKNIFSKKTEELSSSLSPISDNFQQHMDNHNLGADDIDSIPTTSHLKEGDNSPAKNHNEYETQDTNKLLKQIIEQQKTIIEQYLVITKQCDSNARQINGLKGCMIEIKNILDMNNTAKSGPIILLEEETDEILKNLPCPTITIFDEFEKKLAADKDFNQKVVKKLLALINTRQRIVQNLSTMMREFMSREVGLKYNPKVESETKRAFVKTSFFKIISAIITEKFSKFKESPLKPEVIMNSLSSVLYNCKDWGGKRTERSSKHTKNQNKKKNTNEEKEHIEINSSDKKQRKEMNNEKMIDDE